LTIFSADLSEKGAQQLLMLTVHIAFNLQENILPIFPQLTTLIPGTLFSLLKSLEDIGQKIGHVQP